MSADNLRIWDALYKTDPKHTKPFKRAGGFSGTATKPIWLTKRLTEHFGPCGTGWGMDKPDFQTVTAGDEILVFCTVALWYQENRTIDGARAVVYGVGGDKVFAKRQSGGFTNDEAFKASYTDALSNAMKQIGVAADIHMGLFEDQKYLREVTEEFKQVPMGSHPGDFADEARKDGLTNETRSTYSIAAAANAKKWADTAIETLKMALTAEHVDGWRDDNTKALERLEKNHPAEYRRVDEAATERRDTLSARVAA